jgi:hypothetical protein
LPELPNKQKNANHVASSKQRSSAIIEEEIDILAREFVPEEVDVITSLRNDIKNHQISERRVEIEGQDHLHLKPLPPLELGPESEFRPLLEENEIQSCTGFTKAEQTVFDLLKDQRACVKMIKNSEWPIFLHRFLEPEVKKTITKTRPTIHDDIAPSKDYPLNSFVTSTTLLPPMGKKMKSYGSLHAYQCGVIFALPDHSGNESEEEAVKRTETWAWPAGYAGMQKRNPPSTTKRFTD